MLTHPARRLRTRRRGGRVAPIRPVTTVIVLATAVLVVCAPVDAAARRTVFTVSAPTSVYVATAGELARWTRISRHADLGTTRAEARRLAFAELLSVVWIESEAAERGIVVPDAIVSRELDAQRRQSFRSRREFRRFLRDTGQTVTDIWRRVRLTLLVDAIHDQVTAGAAGSVTDTDVDAYIAEHGTGRVPERRDVRVVITGRREDALQAKRELLGGARWRSVARRYSVDEPSREAGGRLSDLAEGTLERRLDRAVFRAPKGRVRGPVRSRSGYWVFSVTRLHPAHAIPEDEWRRTVRRLLVRRARQDELDRFAAAFAAKWRSRTVCAAGYRRNPGCSNPSFDAAAPAP
jgi:foldase protein PrsA